MYLRGFDSEGNLIKAWGGKGEGYDWPSNEHGIYIDAKGFVWLAGNGENDGQILKFTQDGRFVMQIGKSGPQTDSRDTTRLGRPAQVQVDPATNRLDEETLVSMGEQGEYAPGSPGGVTVDLPPGHYVVMCNIAGHYKNGMHADFEVVAN